MKIAVFSGNGEIIILPVDQATLIPIGAETWFEDAGRLYCEYDFDLFDFSAGINLVSTIKIDIGDSYSQEAELPSHEQWFDNKLSQQQ
jgi:hypothetical protein